MFNTEMNDFIKHICFLFGYMTVVFVNYPSNNCAKRMAQHSAITMILINLSPKGCLNFLDFLLLTILEMENE